MSLLYPRHIMIDGEFLIQLVCIACIYPFTCTPRDALNFRMINRESRKTVDKNLWFWIHDRFIPCIVGLPHDLRPAYYIKLLQNYFFGKWGEDPLSVLRIVRLILNRRPLENIDGEEDVLNLYQIHLLFEYAYMEHGRVMLSEALDRWDRDPENDHNEFTAWRLEYFRQFLKFAFVINPDAAVFIGVREKGGYHLQMVDFTEWKLDTTKKPIGVLSIIADFCTSMWHRLSRVLVKRI